MKKNRESPVASNVFVLTFMEVLQALNGSGSAFTARQDREGYLSTVRTSQVVTEQTFHTENRPVYPFNHWLRLLVWRKECAPTKTTLSCHEVALEWESFVFGSRHLCDTGLPIVTRV